MPLNCFGGVTTRKKAAYSYAHVGTGDMFAIAAALNVPRIRRKKAGDPSARDPIPVIARDLRAFNDLLEARSAENKGARVNCMLARERKDRYKAELAGVRRERNRLLDQAGSPDVLDIELEHSLWDTAREDERVTAGLASARSSSKLAEDYLDAVTQTDVLPPQPQLLRNLAPRHSKLYVLGHGTAGAGIVSPTNRIDDAVSMQALAQGLKDAGLNPKMRSLRLISCKSADSEHRTAFIADPPARTQAGTAPAQIFADALRDVGFRNPKVTGYQGSWMVREPGLTRVQAFKDQQGNYLDTRRSSEAAKVFKPSKRVLPPI